MSETVKVLKSRRSIRSFQDKQVSDTDLRAVLEAGTYAPSGKGAQSCIIIAVQNKEDIAALTRMNAAVMGTSNDPYYGAPTILLILADRSAATPVEDGSAVTTYLLLAAEALGLGACWINRERQMFDSEEGKALLKKWGVKGEYMGVAACSLGYAAGEMKAPAARKADYFRIIK
ncbi:MAG: nitroreductase family protein [Desulfovibrio sp.]|nr:nitroreductase family protein [Desulfovibrio sp.]